MNHLINRILNLFNKTPMGIVICLAVIVLVAFYLGQKSSGVDYNTLLKMSRENAEVVRLRTEAESAKKTAADALNAVTAKDLEIKALASQIAQLDETLAASRTATTTKRKSYESSKTVDFGHDDRPVAERITDLCAELAKVGRPCTTAN